MIQCHEDEFCHFSKNVCMLKTKRCKSELDCGVNQACEKYGTNHNLKKCQWRDYGGVKPKPHVPINVGPLVERKCDNCSKGFECHDKTKKCIKVLKKCNPL